MVVPFATAAQLSLLHQPRLDVALLQGMKPESPKMAWESQTRYSECGRIAVIMVGLPARGKSFIARNLARYLQWIGVQTQVVSLATIRSASIGTALRAPFFDPKNKEALDKRTEIADKALNELIAGFESGRQVGILDASNTTQARRQYIHSLLTGHGINVIFLECLYGCEEDLVETHVQELRLTCPEYDGLSDQDAVSDFKMRIQFYRPDYVTMADSQDQHFPYIQIYDGGHRITANLIGGFLPTKILFYLMNIRQAKRSIYMVQPSALADPSVVCRVMKGRAVLVWTDVSEEASRIASHFHDQSMVRIRATLGKIDPGVTEDLSADQVRERFPEEYKRHCMDPYHHRYPRAESYHDLVIRLESIIMELERDTNNVLIIADASVLRCIYAYYIAATPFLIPSLVLDAHELVLLQPEAYGCHETRFDVQTGDETTSRIFRHYQGPM